MRFLVDECLTPLVAELLTAAGHDAAHVVALGLGGHPDVEVMARAVADDRVLISADTDFGELLALGGASVPSVILLRRHHEPASQAGAVIGAFPDIAEALRSGAVVVITADRVRIRELPIA